jgi:hypothetical protein
VNLGDVMDEVAMRLKAIPGLRVHPYPADSVNPPAAVVAWPERYDFDETYGRGSDRLTLPLVLVVSRVPDRAARDHLSKFCDGTGPASVKAALEAGVGKAFDSLRVQGIEFDVVQIAQNDYLAATFKLDIIGPGSAK